MKKVKPRYLMEEDDTWEGASRSFLVWALPRSGLGREKRTLNKRKSSGLQMVWESRTATWEKKKPLAFKNGGGLRNKWEVKPCGPTWNLYSTRDGWGGSTAKNKNGGRKGELRGKKVGKKKLGLTGLGPDAGKPTD